MYSSIRTGRVEIGVDGVDPLHQLLDRSDHRVELDADRAVLALRLHDDRKVDVVRPVEAAPVDGREIGRADAVEGEDLLGDRLVLREVEPVRAGAGVGDPEEIEVGGDVDVLGVVARVGLGEVENQVEIGARERLQRAGAAVQAMVGRPRGPSSSGPQRSPRGRLFSLFAREVFWRALGDGGGASSWSSNQAS